MDLGKSNLLDMMFGMGNQGHSSWETHMVLLWMSLGRMNLMDIGLRQLNLLGS